MKNQESTSEKSYPVLDKLSSPKDIKKMSIEKMQNLCEDIRHRVSGVVRETGGHLGPNLGVVELTVACHKVFDLDKDRLVFDVGHQSYPHKLISGRHKEFDTLRQKKGISGYPNQHESKYDVFRSGHASTAVSTSLGIAEAFNRTNKNNHVIAIVGDGSMTGGMAFEGLNHAGHLNSNNMIVILNDNRMSISPTVGALSGYLNKLRHNKFVSNVKDEIINFVNKNLPKVGESLSEIANLIVDESRTLINPGQIFTILGFDYFGPIEGHNLKGLIETLEDVKTRKGPILIHVLTDKGKDYMPHGKNGELIQGPHALSPKTREKEELAKQKVLEKPKAISYSAQFVESLIKIAKDQKNVVAITAAMADGTGLNKFQKLYPDQYYDVGICEQHATGFTAGLSSAQIKPIFAVYSTFLQRAFDQIFHDIVLQGNLYPIFCIDRAGVVGDDGPSHHGVYDIGYLRVFPNMVLMAPKDGSELESMLHYALTLKAPVAIRYPRTSVPPEGYFNKKDEKIKIGLPELIIKGKKIAVLAYGSCVKTAKDAIDSLSAIKKVNAQISLYNTRFAKPLNEKFYCQLFNEYSYIITMEEGSIVGGYGSAVSQMYLATHTQSNDKLNCKITSLAVPDKLIEHASREEQLKECGLDKNSLIKTIKNILN